MLEKVTDTARELLLFKSETTTIPYAKEVANYFGICVPQELRSDFGFWASVLHFEMRYLSLDFFLEKNDSPAVLELSSGFSLRGLEYVRKNPGKMYFDTDLQSIINVKMDILQHLDTPLPNTLKFQELDVFKLDNNRIEECELLIVNEGLLMYYTKTEQCRILKNIYSVLEKNGGTWVTADVYIKHETGEVGSDKDKKWERFFKSKNVNENYFDSFDQAEQFFYDNGFIIEDKYEPQFEKFSSLPSLFGVASAEQIEVLRNKGNVQQTWKLKVR
ncbi:hypothetical protein [Chryseobacterium flavum]|uniref:hypothetical protein n=1 Tax=Chryseobacterium flavum TaxID=415851 RepID=UPI0028A92DB7|nr:hypothetical protein [Chryseobacterium flavum]